MASPGSFAAGSVLTAAEMNDLPAGIVGSDVVTANLSLTTSPQTTHTVTFTAVSGRKYLAIFTGLVEGNSASGAQYRFDIEQDATRLYAGRKDTAQANAIETVSCSVELPNSSGSTTVTVEMSMNTGTAQMTAAATVRSTLIVLDVGN